MVSKFEVLEYLLVFGRSTRRDLYMLFGKLVDWKLRQLINTSYVEKIKGKDGIYYFLLTKNAMQYLKHTKDFDFIDGNPRAEYIERVTGRKFWRPTEIARQRMKIARQRMRQEMEE